MAFKFAHSNYNVLDLDRSIKFYEEALGLKQTGEINEEGFKIVFMGTDLSEHLLELTMLFDRKEPYNLGDNEIHLAFKTDDFEGSLAKHKEMGCVCFENPSMGVYFIVDPDGYWMEVIPNDK